MLVQKSICAALFCAAICFSQFAHGADADAVASAITNNAAKNPAASELTADEELFVTALRMETTALETGTSISVITAEEIEARGYSFALDAIAGAAGATVNQNGAIGGQASVRLRGASSDQTLVLIDGMAVNDPSSPGGGYNFASLDVAAIERIEILKGPQSTLWGTDAIGGVVNIITKRPDSGLGLSIYGEAGSFDTVRAGGAICRSCFDTTGYCGLSRA